MWAVAFVGTFALGIRYFSNPGTAFSAAVLIYLIVAALSIQIFPSVPLGFETSISALVGTVIFFQSYQLLANRAGTLERMRATSWGTVLAVLAYPALISIYFSFRYLRGYFGLSWAMQNDSAWNIVVARMMFSDAGVSANREANPSPLMPGLLSFSFAGNRSAIPENLLLEHDVVSAASLWISLILFAGVAGGLLANVICRHAPSLIRLIAIVASTVAPSLWFCFGYSIEFGFYNASLAILILLCILLAWLSPPKNNYSLGWIMAVATIVSLAAWAPIAIFPMGFLLVQIFPKTPQIGGARTWKHLFVRASPLLLIACYFALVTLRDLLGEKNGLSADGGIFQLSPVQAAIFILVPLSIICVAGLTISDKLFSTAVIVASSFATGLAFLLWQRRTQSNLWGYYPVKFTWLVGCVIVFVAIPAALAIAAGTGTKNRNRMTLGLLLLATVFTVCLQLGPRVEPRLQALFPTVSIARGTSYSVLDNAARALFLLPNNSKPVLVHDLLSKPEDDFINFWTIQTQSDRSDSPIRWFAYYQDSTDVNQVCVAAKAWGPGTQIISRNNQANSGNVLGVTCDK
jgi:hypothetical protein